VIYEEYFKYTDQHKKDYGERTTLVLMQVGSFFEMYGLKRADEILLEISVIERAAQVCMLKVADKKDKYSYRGGETMSVVMAGFGEASLDKYLPILVEAGFSCAVYVQEDDMTKRGAKKRVLHGVYSAGTYFPVADVAAPVLSSHYTMVIWIHKYRVIGGGGTKSAVSKYICGFATSSCSTGESFLYEYTTPVMQTLQPTSFDDLERAVTSFMPREIVLISGLTPSEEDRVLQFMGASSVLLIHRVQETDEKAVRCAKPAYMDAILKTHYGGMDCRQQIQEFTLYEFATQCFCYLLDFLHNHSPHLVSKIRLPTFSNTSRRMVLGNHTLTQLNISGGGATTSVSAFLNECVTAMGKRAFHNRILQPVFDIDWLNREYEATDRMIRSHMNDVGRLRRRMSNVRDIDRIIREIVHEKAAPASLWHLCNAVELLQEEMVCYGGLYSSEKWWTPDMEAQTKHFLKQMRGMLDLEVCRSVTSLSSEQIFCRGFDAGIDSLQDEYRLVRETLEQIRVKLNEGVGGDYVKWHETAKSGAFFQLTANRGQHLSKWLLKTEGEVIPGILYREIRVEGGGGGGGSSTDKMSHVQHGGITTLLRRLYHLEDRLAAQLQEVYCRRVLVGVLQNEWLDFLTSVSQILARFDVVQSVAYVAFHNGYCRPQISEAAVAAKAGASSFVRARQLRHPLIEHLQKNETYVPNDVSLGDEERGILLYGTNAVGKTSLIKAIGVAVIMAQAGMFVPCSEFTYYPYDAIYSRILGNDDLFKGLSTFVVEMSELRTILMEASPAVLVLGDEVCSGTETESALSIFTAALLRLHKMGASFLFATHFHEVSRYSEIREQMADAVAMKHMSFFFNAEKNVLEYDRKLRDGAGPAIYGLEVAKSLFMPVDFIDDAFRIREKYFPLGKTVLSMPTASYNRGVIRSPLCQICRVEIGQEIHHLQPQAVAASDSGLIRTEDGAVFHKNHPANLITLCRRCHDLVHSATATATAI
jgi:DNA mismatch repair protein MutS